MKFYSILILLGVCQIYGTETENEEEYDPAEILLVKTLFSKLNTILEENAEMRKQLGEIDKRQKEQTEKLTLEFHNINQRLNEQNQKFTGELLNLNTSIQDLPKSLQIQTNNLEFGLQNIVKRFDQQEIIIKQFTSVSKPLNDLTCVKKPGNWRVIQRRTNGLVNFDRNWQDYKQGFGSPDGEFFIGLQELHQITTFEGPQELLINLVDFDNGKRYARYDNFVIGSESEKYVLKNVGIFSGDAGDSLSYHKDSKFSTIDQNNGGVSENCAATFRGAWWFKDCYPTYYSHLNGQYYNSGAIGHYGGIYWWTFRGIYYSLKNVEMMIRPKL